ncbi:MAG: TonB family protein [Roseitalea porphyridii]|jgi:TonB family protein|uniref:TonB family protein n=1 Tax=Roseitalea porphyridii TaxID=1852022 RepID=UPI0032F059C3
MRVGLATSATLHVLVLGWGLITLSEPEAFDVDDVEALPVELVSLAEITQIQEGSEDAPSLEPAAPEPVETPEPEPEAVNVGDNERDQATPETEEQQPVEVEEARLPDPVDVPVPQPVERPEPEPVAEPEPEAPATPATEVAPDPEPAQEVSPDPVEEVIEAAEPEPTPEPESVALPETIPTPTARPERPPAQTAETPNREDRETPQTQAATESPETPDPSETDEVANLLNRERGSGGGAAPSEQTASLGGERSTGGTTLTQSEMDALRSQIQACWNPPAGVIDAAELRVSVRFRLDPSGRVEGQPTITNSSGNRQADESARRAVLRCGMNGYNLPADKYEAWQDVVVNFDPSEMFR